MGDSGERLQKLLSRSGVASRRAADKLIADGRVTVNGETAVPGQRADASRDAIEVDGAPLPEAGRRVYIMLNKPRGYLTAMSDSRGRRTVAQLTAGVGTRVYPAGRLDMDSEGLLLMTNDGEFAMDAAHPSRGKLKVYRVLARGDARDVEKRLSAPMEIDGRTVTAVGVTVLDRSESGILLEITIRQGLNRQIRKMCRLCGLTVVSLVRVSIGGVELGDLPSGQWRHLTADELRRLRRD
jgi:23S rRNA pseudouridine2605 synthase